MRLPAIVVFGFATVQNPTGTVFLHIKTVSLPVAADTGGANISLQNKFVKYETT